MGSKTSKLRMVNYLPALTLLSIMPLRSNSNSTTPVPYRPGKLLQLQVLKNFHNPPLPQSVTAIIHQIFGITMSPVLDVTIETKPGSHIWAVLKLYDRRFGTDRRDVLGKHTPHTAVHEAAFQSFVRQGKMEPFLREMEEETKLNPLPRSLGTALMVPRKAMRSMRRPCGKSAPKVLRTRLEPMSG